MSVEYVEGSTFSCFAHAIQYAKIFSNFTFPFVPHKSAQDSGDYFYIEELLTDARNIFIIHTGTCEHSLLLLKIPSICILNGSRQRLNPIDRPATFPQPDICWQV